MSARRIQKGQGLEACWRRPSLGRPLENCPRQLRDPATLVGLVLCVVWLAHTTAIDRLDITKLAVAITAASLAVLAAAFRVKKPETAGSVDPPKTGAVGSATIETPESVGSRSGRSPTDREISTSHRRGGWIWQSGLRGISFAGLVGICLVVISIAFPRFTAARVEGWAPWFVAGMVFLLVRGSAEPRLERILCLTASVLALVGMAQALGQDWFTARLTLFSHRPVMGTLGNPDLYGVCLAGALPFVLVRARSVPFYLASVGILAAVVLSGSRSAWLMLLPGLVFAVYRLRPYRAVLFFVLGASLALLLDNISSHLDLGGRVADLSQSRGTAAGRLYLWQVNGRVLAEAGPLGGGPEAFRRVWPGIQAEYLADHPEDAHFYSDLRHAHLDMVEIATDWGWIGLGLTLLGVFWLLCPPRYRPWSKGHPRAPAVMDLRFAARMSLLALLLGGLATPVLFEVPSLLLAAVAAGILAPGRPMGTGRLSHLLSALGIVLALFWVGQRTVSEYLRTSGLEDEIAGRLQAARELYVQSAEVDGTNPLAQVMAARGLLDVDPQKALEHARRAAQELPTAAAYSLQAVSAEAAGDTELARRSWSIARILRP